MERRHFLIGTACLAACSRAAAAADTQPVWLVGDDAEPDPVLMARRLATLAQNARVGDTYLRDGAVTELETAFATLLGKEDCAFFPTGTLANQVAARVLAGENHRVLVQHESHFYRDESDAAARLGALNLVPLAQGQVTPPLADIKAALDEAEHGPYKLAIGALTLESPVRRRFGEMVPPADIAAIATLARQHGVKLHLDGARLLLAPATMDIHAYAEPFDTVYVSLYKYLGAPFGAVLAGNKANIAQARELRHLYGGLLYEAWMPALLALDTLKDFRARMAEAHRTGAALLALLEAGGAVKQRQSGLASNIYLLEMSKELADTARARGAAAGVRLAQWKDGVIRLFINTTILRRPAADYAALFLA